MELFDRIRIRCGVIRTVFAYICYKTSGSRPIIRQDLDMWVECTKPFEAPEKSEFMQLNRFMSLKNHRAFRNVFLLRLKTGKNKIQSLIAFAAVRLLYPPLSSLYINTKDIGGGFYIQHGFSTIIVAKSIGKNCWINQQVTIGYNEYDCPIIGDNCKIHAGAKVIGGITMANGSVAGANACVVKDVPENAVVGGVPARVIKYSTPNPM